MRVKARRWRQHASREGQLIFAVIWSIRKVAMSPLRVNGVAALRGRKFVSRGLVCIAAEVRARRFANGPSPPQGREGERDKSPVAREKLPPIRLLTYRGFTLTDMAESVLLTIVNVHIVRANRASWHLLILVVALTISSSASAQLLLSAGESYVYEFNTLPFYGEGYTGFPASGINYATFTTDPASRDPGDAFTVEIFEDNLGQTPLAVGTGSSTVTAQANGGWHDLQGVARVTVTSGALVVDTVSVGTYIPSGGGQFDFYRLDPTAVPEPGTIALWGCALGGVVWSLRRKLR